GGVVRGEIVSEGVDPQDSALVVVKTLSSAVVQIAGADVQSLHRRKLVHEEYVSRAREVADTVEAQSELAEWCRRQGLLNYRKAHFERILELDPQHAAAHKALGHTLRDGIWMTADEYQESRGYVRHRGKWILPQERELLELQEQETEAERQWYKPVRMWYGWVTGENSERQAAGVEQFHALQEAAAAAAVIKTFQKAQAEPLRGLLAETLSNLESPKAVRKLIDLSLADESPWVRSTALNSIRRRARRSAIPAYVRALRNENNLIVNRAGEALEQVGDESAVGPLIEALVTRHRYKIEVPANAIGTTADGRWIQAIDPATLPPNIAGMLATGQLPSGVIVNYGGSAGASATRIVTVKYDEKNPAVLAALTSLTGENFGFDEPAWRRWRSTQQTSPVPLKSRKST
ncbi:MAG: hypothetical protein EHM42_15930, partial [Planctomycetaceae bacterium]